MWSVALICIAVASCNAELYQLKTADLPTTADNRIIGGSATTIQQYPFTVQVLYISQFYCGGSLVTTRHVLSAAHCFVDENGFVMSPSRFSIRAGTTILNSGGTLHLVTRIKIHELYNLPVRNNDVAVVFMATPVNLSISVARIALIPNQNAVVPNNASVIAVGWGLTDVNSGFASTVLNEVTVRKIDRVTCQARYMRLQVATGHAYPVTSHMICAGILDVGGKDACQGDSGGPLIYNGVVVGVTSWGNGCGEADYPGVSARVASFTNWINSTINDYPLPTQTVTDNATGNGTGTGNGINPGGTGSLSSKVGVVTLLAPLLYLMLSV